MVRWLIDTNVLLAASAWHDPGSEAERAMPHDPRLRERIGQWLTTFSLGPDRLVLDEAGLILAEYRRNLPFDRRLHHAEFGMDVLETKIERGLVDFVSIPVLDANGERIAVLPEALETIVTDREDRKWVAAALAAQAAFAGPCPIVYAADSDWRLEEALLARYGLRFLRLLPDRWYQHPSDFAHD